MRFGYGAGMDAVFWAAKRAHQANLKFTRPLLAPYRLTPARYDLMFMLQDWERWNCHLELTQRKLRIALGIARATISEMLAGLEKLGMIARGPCKSDRRTRVVKLTQAGIDALDDAFYNEVCSDLVDFGLECVLGDGDPFNDHNFGHKEIFIHVCKMLRGAFRDTATDELYKWHPDD